MLHKTVRATAAVMLLCSCLASRGFSAEPTPQPRRVSGLKATTMEKRLHREIKEAQHSGRDTTTAEKLKAQGDAELSEGRLRAAKKHYEQAERALGIAK